MKDEHYVTITKRHHEALKKQVSNWRGLYFEENTLRIRAERSRAAYKGRFTRLQNDIFAGKYG
jgi:hypothetical protein